MGIKEVSYERLFSFGQYENEKIRFGATVGEGENPEAILGELVLKITDIEDMLNHYRFLCRDVEDSHCRVTRMEESVCQTEDEMERMKVKIDEIAVALEKGDVDTKLRHACDRQSYKGLTERLTEQKKEVERHQAHYKEVVSKRDEFKKRIKEGNFSVEGITVISRRADYY